MIRVIPPLPTAKTVTLPQSKLFSACAIVNWSGIDEEQDAAGSNILFLIRFEDTSDPMWQD